MNASTSTSKVASLLTTLTACLGLAFGSTGCLIDGSATYSTSDPTIDVTPVDPTPAIAELAIDPGAAMSSDPGNGVGLFVQYDQGGHWNLFTTCDTAITGASCSFDVIVSADRSVVIDNVEGLDLEPSDSVSLNSDGSINLVTDTSFGTNGLTFDADPGAIIEVDMLLDGVAQPRFVYLVSDGALLDGVPSNPVDLAPAAP
jgi:hypothetical protein